MLWLTEKLPNRPNKQFYSAYTFLTFFLQDDPTRKPRYEDDLIAWTWDMVFWNQTAQDFLLRCPMTKVRILYPRFYAHVMKLNCVKPIYVIPYIVYYFYDRQQ